MSGPESRGGRESLGGRIADRLWIGLVAAALAAVAIWAVSTRTQEHELRAAFPEALGLVPGLDVQVDGVDVGKITSVDHEDGQAIVGLGIDDDELWPLHAGTTATIRFGTTLGNGTRLVELDPGPRSAPELGEGGIVESRHTRSPVEFDEVFGTFDRPTRRGLRGLVHSGADVLRGRGRALGRGIEETAPALEALGGVSADLARDEAALARFVDAAAAASGAAGPRREAVERVVTGAAGAFDGLAREADSASASLAGLRPTLARARRTLARVDASADGLEHLFGDLAPGARALVPLARDGRAALEGLGATAPRLRRSLAALRRAAPPSAALLSRAAPLLEDTGPAARDLVPSLACVRPYAPEFAGFLANWSGLAQNYDSLGHYGRFHILASPHAGTSNPPRTSAEAASFPGVEYAFPRPPGLNAGQPWLMPECEVGEDALDPAKDPEDAP